MHGNCTSRGSTKYKGIVLSLMTITREWKSHYTGWRTRVLVNDPTRGYEIFIEKMLDAAEGQLGQGKTTPVLFLRAR